MWRYEALKKVPILFSLTEAQLWQLSGAMQTEALPKGAMVFKKGDPGDSFYIIKEGIFTCCDGEAQNNALHSPAPRFPRPVPLAYPQVYPPGLSPGLSPWSIPRPIPLINHYWPWPMLRL